MEAAEVHAKYDQVLRLVETNREVILITKNGVPHCLMQPASKVEAQMLVSLRRRKC